MTKQKIPDNATIRLVDLPPGIGGAVMEDEDGYLSIYVNSRHGYYAQLDDLDHELAHIENDDLHNDDPIEVIESRADANATSHRLPRLIKASDLLPPQNPIAAAPAPPQPQPNSHATLSPHQAAVLLSAISDLDDWLFRDASYDI